MQEACPRSKKRMFRSRGAALRSGRERYGMASNVYRCPGCRHWHLTRRDIDPHVELLAAALLGRKAS
jgi:hypothetical protein